MSIITEEMRFRQRLCEYARKNGVSKAARKYKTNRMFVYRQLAKWDGGVRSLCFKSRRPHRSPNEHSDQELYLINYNLSKHGLYGYAEVYRQCREYGYNRHFGSMCRQIRKKGLIVKPKHKKSYTKYTKITGQYVGDKIQIDIKYVPKECIMFQSFGKSFYQITAIDEYSRKRILKIVEEKSTYETSLFLQELEALMGFPIKRIQVDNGPEFVNDKEQTGKLSLFQEVAKAKKYELIRIRPYSPWQNGKVERSHREDGKILYNNNVFYSKKELIDAVQKHEYMYNNTAKVCLDFKSPNEIVEENKRLIGLI